MEAPIKSLITLIDTEISAVAFAAAAKISGVITPIIGVCFSIYMILICVNYMRGGLSSPVWDIYLRAAGFAIIIGIGLNAEGYTQNVVPMIQTMGDDLAQAVSGADSDATSLDKMVLSYVDFLEKRHEKFSKLDVWDDGLGTIMIQAVMLVVMFIIIAVGLVPFVILATVLLISAKVGMALVAAVGPIFFACAIFPATRQYFSSWCNCVFSYALVPLFVALVAMGGVRISQTTFKEINIMGSSEILFKLIGVAIINLILLYLLKLCSSLASSLSAGGINAGSPTGAAGGLGRMLGKYKAGAAEKWAGNKAASGAKKTWEYAKEKLRGNNIKPG